MDVFKIIGVLLVLVLWHTPCLGQDTMSELFSIEDMDGLQSLWRAWNATPNPGSNLFNWYTRTGRDDIPFPCNTHKNWQGVTCLQYRLNATNSITWVIGLELDDASIAGTLPSEISQLKTLASLKLTGNPDLRGNLPKELADIPLTILDLHDNGFDGSISKEILNINTLLELDLSGNKLSGAIPVNAFENMTQLLTLDLSRNELTGPFRRLNYTLATLSYLNLSYNSFSELPELSKSFNNWLPSNVSVVDLSGLNIGGVLPRDWSAHLDLLSREELYLNENNISGVLNITSIENLSIDKNLNLKNISVLSLKNNRITDVIFDQKFLNSSGNIKFYLGGNPYCSTASANADGRRCFCEQYCAISEPPKKSDSKVIIIPTVISGVILLAVIVCLAIIIHRKNKYMDTLLRRFEESDVKAKRYDYHELRAATKNFSEERKLGQGGYGTVYKGILTSNTQVAVKQLSMKTEQASKDFLNEVLLITNLQHRNLVTLKGYCLHGKEMLLVYELVDFCDLDKLLFQDSSSINERQVVDWSARKRICLGIAQGLYYLHASSHTKIIHRDIKASNILLDKDLNAKIADFGLARPIEDKNSEIVTQRGAGTLGYIAPEYVLYGQLSEKADVYSFGVLLLEIVSGTRNKDPNQSEDEVYLPTRAWKRHKDDKLMEVMDPKLHVNEHEEMEVRQVLEMAVMCINKSPVKRPTMFRVVAMLVGNVDEDVVDVSIEDADCWPEYISPSGFHNDDPLLMASSSTAGSTSTGPITNGNATIQLRTIVTR